MIFRKLLANKDKMQNLKTAHDFIVFKGQQKKKHFVLNYWRFRLF